MLPYLKRDDIEIGMSVYTYQLDSIYNEYIYLSNVTQENDENGFPVLYKGNIEFIGRDKEKFMMDNYDRLGELLLIINNPN